MNACAIVLALLALPLAGCGASTNTEPMPPPRAPHSPFGRSAQPRTKAYLAATPTEYAADAITVRDGSRVMSFPSSATVSKDASGTTVFDPRSRRTFRFSAHARIVTEIGAGHIYVMRGDPLPAWARASHARPVVR